MARLSFRFFRRNSIGSILALAAMMSIWDSRAKELVLLPGRSPGAGGKGMRIGSAAETAADGGGAMIRDVVEQLRPAGAGKVDVVVPKHGLALFGEARLDLDDGGRPEGVIEELLLPAPAHLDGLAGRLGQPRGLDGLLAGALAAESAADEGRDDAHVLRLEAEGAGNLVLQRRKASGWRSRPWPCCLRPGPGRCGFPWPNGPCNHRGTSALRGFRPASGLLRDCRPAADARCRRRRS